MRLLNMTMETVSGTPGVGTISLSGAAIAPYKTWAGAGAVTGRRYAYKIVDGSDWELGEGIFTDGSPDTLTRNLVASSTGALLNLTSAAVVACVAHADIGPEVVLSTQTVAGVASVIFDNTMVTSEFKMYKLRCHGVTGSVASATPGLQFSPDNGATWRTTAYNGTRSIWQVNGTFSNKVNTGTTYIPVIPEMTNDATYPGFGEMLLQNPASAAVKKTARASGVMKAGDGHRYEFACSGEYTTAEAHNAMRIIPSTGTLTGTFTLIGMR